MTTAEQLLDDYNHYRDQTDHIRQLRARGEFVRSLGAKNNLKAFQALVDWCGENRVEPRRWLASLFHTRRWLFAPQIKHLRSKNHLVRYPDIKTIPAYTNRLSQQRTVQQHTDGKIFDPNRDMSWSAETLKRRYQAIGDTGRCMSAMQTETFGFHPKSTVCSTCQAKQACLRQLQSTVSFDIMALRRGEITAEQARAVVYYGRGGH